MVVLRLNFDNKGLQLSFLVPVFIGGAQSFSLKSLNTPLAKILPTQMALGNIQPEHLNALTCKTEIGMKGLSGGLC